MVFTCPNDGSRHKAMLSGNLLDSLVVDKAIYNWLIMLKPRCACEQEFCTGKKLILPHEGNLSVISIYNLDMHEVLECSPLCT